jgi:hypothetical protein
MTIENSLPSSSSLDSHALGKQHLQAATAALSAGDSDEVLFHLATAKELLRPGSHRHPEIIEAIAKLKATPEKVHEPISSLEPELTPEEASSQLEKVFDDDCHQALNLVRRRLTEGNFWELDAFFAGPSKLHYVTITHATPETTFPLLFVVIDHYTRDAWFFSSFAGCVDKVRHLITV